MREAYEQKNFRASSLEIIDQANVIIGEYRNQGYELTLRQLYYQFVARDLIENSQRSYKRIGSLISDARLAGMVDWSAIVDRTRNLKLNYHSEGVSDVLWDAAHTYKRDLWVDQPYAVEVWIEKEALIGVIASVCDELDVPYFACRGYVSQSEIWKAGKRALNRNRDQQTIILHLGDHDPSGVDMTRDNQHRLNMFSGYNVIVKRIALNYDQIVIHQPPPNPAKLTDTRARRYITEYGWDSWELDALEPSLINELIRNEIVEYTDTQLMEAAIEREEKEKQQLTDWAGQWEEKNE